MALNLKMGADISGFTAGIKEGQQSLKALKAEMKASEAEFKATGNAEQKMASQTKTLTDQLNTQKNIAAQAQKALDAMAKGGVTEADAAYQKMYITLMNAKAGAAEAQAALNALGQSTEEAGSSADKTAQSLAGISKKMSLDQVISGIDSITGGLENAAKKAIDLGEKLFSVIMDSAAAADDIETLAVRMGLTPQQVQQMKYVAAEFEAPAETIAKTWKKVRLNLSSDSAEIVDGFKELGVATHEIFGGKYGEVQGAARDYVDVFWEVGEALMHITDASKQERLAQSLLGRSWDELIPLFTKGREAYEEALNAAPTASDEAVENMASLNDRMKELEKSWGTLKLQALNTIAPALEKGADALATLIDKVTKYLETDKGQELMKNLGDAVSGLFDDLANIDPEKVVENFSTLFQGVVGSFEWLKENWGAVKAALIGIAAGFGVLKIATLALNISKVVSGLGDLIPKGGTTTATGDATGGGNPGLLGNNSGVTMLDTIMGQAMATGSVLQMQYQMQKISKLLDGTEEGVKAWGEANTQAGFWTESEKDKLIQQNIDFLNAAKSLANTQEQEVKRVESLGGVIHKDRRTGKVLDSYGSGEAYYNWLTEYGTENPVDVTVEPKPSITWNEDILKQVGGMEVPVILTVTGLEGFGGLEMGTWFGSKGFRTDGNSVSSNLYVESMYMNNGQDAAGLAASMAEAARRAMSGFGN